MISVAEAQRRLLASVIPLPSEILPLAEAAGRWASKPIVARRTQPAADLSAMDGYALRFAELPGPWAVVGESAAGGHARAPVGPGEAMRIFTGAPLPPGADTVLVQEEAVRESALLRLAGEGPRAPGRNVRVKGSDFVEGTVLIAEGQRLTPARIALAAIGGHGALPVGPRIRVALVSTGNELAPPGAPTSGMFLPASNGPMIAAQLGGLPVELIDHGILPDDREAIAAALYRAAAEADIVVTTGGASVGDHDLVRPAILAAGGSIDFWKVAMRPGKPLMAGRIGKAMLLGLPGNPVSAFVTSILFLKPLIAALGGAAAPFPALRSVLSGADLESVGVREEYVRGCWQDGKAVPLGMQDSAGLADLAHAELLIARAANAPAVAAGEAISVLDLA